MIDFEIIKKYIAKKKGEESIKNNKNVLGALEKIELMIADYEESHNPKYAYRILQFIESIQFEKPSIISSLFSSTPASMREGLSNKGFAPQTTPEDDQKIRERVGFDAALPSTSEGVLGSIYKDLHVKMKNEAIVWFYEAKTEQSNVVHNSVIDEWSKSMTAIPIEEPDKACVDYKRKTRIYDETQCKSNEDIENQLNKLIEASKYKNENEETKKKIKAWLRANGGQQINFYISNMIKNNTGLPLDIPQNTIGPTTYIDNSDNSEHLIDRATTAFNQNNPIWTIDGNGEIIYKQDYQVEAIKYGVSSAIMRKADGSVGEVSSDDSNYERLQSSHNQQHETPLFGIYSTVRLDMHADGFLIPRVTSLVTVSHTDFFKLKPNAQLSQDVDEHRVYKLPDRPTRSGPI